MSRKPWSETGARDTYVADRRRLMELVSEFRDKANGCHWCGIPVIEMRRDELLALLAMLVANKATVGI